jgi:hypothetical protein
MKQYKKWSPEFRQASLKLTNRAKKLGWIDNPRECNRCKQTKGILHLHNEDYDITHNTLEKVFNTFPITIALSELKLIRSVLEPLCWRCHMMHHSVRRNPTAVKEYFEEIKQGKQYNPVYRHDFDILKNDHNV